MYIYETKLGKSSPVPKHLDFLRAADQRELLKGKKELSLYRNLAIGAQGEQIVLDALERFGLKDWVVLPNLWLEYFGIYESDIVVLTKHAPYVFEVKNYDGLFEYRESRCLVNGKRIKENCIQQAEKAWLNLQDICRGMDRSITAKGALLMVGEHNDVRIESDVKDIEVVTRYQLRNYIREIARMDSGFSRNNYDIQRLLCYFENNEVLNPFGPHASYTPEEVLDLGRRGIYCKTCGSYKVETSRKFVRCQNGHEELRRDAIKRTIHEFGVLTFEHDYMNRRDLQMFLGEQTSRDLLIDILNTHFVKNQGGKYTNYVNKKALF